MTYVSSGQVIVAAVNAQIQVFKRLGISTAMLTEPSWDRLSGNLEVVDAYNISAPGVSTKTTESSTAKPDRATAR